MRTLALLKITLIFITILFFVNCRKKGCTNYEAENYSSAAIIDDGSCNFKEFKFENIKINGILYYIIQGNIDNNIILESSKKYILRGGVFVKKNNTITIEAGTYIYAETGSTTSFLSIEAGAKINAQGTAENPIIFTSFNILSSTANPGDWGGLIINGYGIINAGSTAEGEGGTGTYGGNDDDDNSGVMRYIRVEYAGKILGTDNELNGFSFNAVGSSTILEYLEAYKGSDDGFEFFGGKANLKYALSIANQDDSFDWTHGWRGNGQFWVAMYGGDRGIEGDNSSSNNYAIPCSSPNIYNATLIGQNDGDNSNIGVLLREGTAGKFENFIVVNYPKFGLKIDGISTIEKANNNLLYFNNSSFYGNSINFNDETNNLIVNGKFRFLNIEDNPLFTDFCVGTISTNASNPGDSAIWFSNVDYKGAVSIDNNWTNNNWAKFAD